MLRRIFISLSSALAVLAFAHSALGQEPLDVDTPQPSPPAAAGTEQAVVARYWELGRPRLFFGSTLEAGYAYLRPKFALGYGLPYWRWISFEVWPLLSLSSVGGYGGISAGLPGFTVR